MMKSHLVIDFPIEAPAAKALPEELPSVMPELAQDPAESVFVMPREDGSRMEVAGFSSFITTRAAAYLFLPSINAMRLIADIGAR